MLFLSAFLVAMLTAGRLSAQPAPPRPIRPLKVRPPARRVEELERRLRELAARVMELESADGSKAPKNTAADGKSSDGAAQGPAAEAPTPPREEPSTVSQTGPISGYMDFHLNRPEHEDPQLDFHRFVLLFNHSFSDRIRFIGELELEHALVEGLEESGELELEQAYLDFRVNRAFNVRAGMLLAPVGIINERHEPPSFHGVERPFVDTFIIPDDLVRRRRRRSRHVRRGLALPRVPDGAARRDPHHRRRRTRRGAPEGVPVERAQHRADRAARIRRASRADARHELLAGQDRLQLPPRGLHVGSSNSTAGTTRVRSRSAASSPRSSSTAPTS